MYSFSLTCWPGGWPEGLGTAGQSCDREKENRRRGIIPDPMDGGLSFCPQCGALPTFLLGTDRRSRSRPPGRPVKRRAPHVEEREDMRCEEDPAPIHSWDNVLPGLLQQPMSRHQEQSAGRWWMDVAGVVSLFLLCNARHLHPPPPARRKDSWNASCQPKVGSSTQGSVSWIFPPALCSFLQAVDKFPP